jgi:hypothetical protein
MKVSCFPSPTPDGVPHIVDSSYVLLLVRVARFLSQSTPSGSSLISSVQSPDVVGFPLCSIEEEEKESCDCFLLRKGTSYATVSPSHAA